MQCKWRVGQAWPDACLECEAVGFFYSIQWGITVKTLSAFLAAAFLATLCGCNTVEGAGKDVKATGQAVENAADKAKPK